MIGLTKLPPGRTGNKLLHYNFLRQIAQKANINYFHLAINELSFCEHMNERRRYFVIRKCKELLKRELFITPAFVNQFTPPEFISFIRKHNSLGYDMYLDEPFITDLFFDYLFFDPNEFIKLTPTLTAPYKNLFLQSHQQQLFIGIHFRGTDFYTWDNNAVLDSSYYINALELCFATFTHYHLSFLIFTDDKENNIVKNIRKKLHTRTIIHISDLNTPLYEDLYKLSQCDIVISSPSTFAIIGSILGKKKKVIHSQQWLSYAQQNPKKHGDFWQKLYTTKNQFYQLWKSI